MNVTDKMFFEYGSWLPQNQLVNNPEFFIHFFRKNNSYVSSVALRALYIFMYSVLLFSSPNKPQR